MIPIQKGAYKGVGDSRNLKHELRTPINHIVGYGALLLESAQDAGDDVLVRCVIEIQNLGRELHVAVEGILLHSEGMLRVQDIASILNAIAPLAAKVEDNLLSSNVSLVDETFLKDMRRIEGAIQRLRSLVDGILSSRGEETPKSITL